MTDILFFNQKTFEMRYVQPHQNEVRERLKGEGWIENPALVHMHHPRPPGGQPANINIPVQDQKFWENKGYYARPTMIYHPKEGTQMVPEEEAKKAFQHGWYASPAHFPGNDLGELKQVVSQEPTNVPVKRGRPKGAIDVTEVRGAA